MKAFTDKDNNNWIETTAHSRNGEYSNDYPAMFMLGDVSSVMRTVVRTDDGWSVLIFKNGLTMTVKIPIEEMKRMLVEGVKGDNVEASNG